MSVTNMLPGEKAAFPAADKIFSVDGASLDEDFERPSLSFPKVE